MRQISKCFQQGHVFVIQKEGRCPIEPLQPLQGLLTAFHPGRLQPPLSLLPWFPPPALTYFLQYAKETKPRHILSGVGKPLECHKTTLEASLMFPKSSPWLGFRLTWTDDGWLWWFHSWLVLPTGSILDSGPETLEAKYVGVRWGTELHACHPKLRRHE
jgi:hypothetical protein